MSTNKLITCHECGSDVAQADVFCPFCGISLEPVAVASDQTDESLASTIMISASEFTSLSEAPVSTMVENVVPKAHAEENPPPSEDISTDFSIDDVPPPPTILSGSMRTVDNLLPSSTSELNVETEAENTATDLEAVGSLIEDRTAGVSPHDEKAHSNTIETVPASSFFPGEEKAPPPEMSGLVDAATADVSAEPTSVHPGDAEPISTSVSGSKQLAEAESGELAAQEPAIQDANSIAADPSQIVAGESIQEAAPNELHSVTEPVGISKPLDILETPDGFKSNSTFDSVRIIENRQPGSNEDVDTIIHSGFLPPDASTHSSESGQDGTNKASSSQPEISSTAHNLGIGETDGRKGAKLKPLTEGTVLNSRYEIVRKIGGGGMGAVYLASDNNLGGVLRAVKEMVQAHIEEEQQEKAINDFKRESMILSSLDHVSIPTIYDYFYDDKESRFYLVMKYISGGDLSSRLRSAQEGKIDEKSVTEWAIQIIDVLDYLHNQPSTIVYRDLKPSNIMIDGNSGRAMLIDFGIARSINQKEEKGVTAVGTMGYAPPELFSGNVEPRSDIYSLGSTMFHLLTGADPQSNPLLIFDFQKNPRPRQINPQLSDQIERILMKSVEYNADARFKSAAEMREFLEEHLVKLKNGMLTYGITEIPASVSLANQSVFCGFCGQRIVATDLFCGFCGAKQPLAQQGVRSEIYSQGSWTAKLVIEGTSELSAPAFSLQKEDNLLGRRDPMSNIFPEVDLSKYDPQTKISRRHARIWREGSNYLVEDLGSSNGTILTRSASDPFRLVPKQPQVLTAGDKIRVGDATLHFIIG